MTQPDVLLVGGLIAHFWGDYGLQSDWMAYEKEKRWPPAVVHGLYWLKNQIGPQRYRVHWRDIRTEWTWLMIIIDNTLHVTINSAALLWL